MMISHLVVVWTTILSPNLYADEPAPCAKVSNLIDALGCVRTNEPAYRDAVSDEKEAEELKSSAYRLINPELSLDYLSGSSFGSAQKEMNVSLMFMFELGGKRSAREQVFSAEGLVLRADAFEQRMRALTDLGGAVLRLNQLNREKEVLQESLDTFRGVIRLYRSRGQLPPEQQVGLNAFELITLDYEKRLLENEAELIRIQARTARLFGKQATGLPLDLKKLSLDVGRATESMNEWLENTPEMMRLRSEQRTVEGNLAVARADMWPDLKIGPAFRRITNGSFSYSMTGIAVSFPIPLLTWNSALRMSRVTTEKRVQAGIRWDAQDIRSQYAALLTQLEKISKLLRESQSEAEIQRKHHQTESYFQRGLVGGALVIEAHRSLVDYFQTKHSLERKFLEDSLKIQALAQQGNSP